MEDQSPSPTEPARVPDGGAAMHTPGPWRIQKSTPGEEAISTSPELCLWVTSDRWGQFAQVAKTSRGDVEGDANARLIAAAPDLLSSVDALLALHIAHHNNPVHVAARAAIAKARGA